MIGGGLVRFHPDKRMDPRQSGDGLSWKRIKASAPALLRDVMTGTAMKGLKGLNAGARGGRPNWKGGLAGVKTGAKSALKRKTNQEIKKLVAKRVKRDVFEL